METITSSTEISQIFTQGKHVSASCIALIIMKKQHDQPGRVAFIAGKKIGNAVYRNRAKRRMRALCAEVGGPWNGYDVIFLARPLTNKTSYSKVLITVNNLLLKAHISKKEQ